MSAANPELPSLSIEYCLECCETLRALHDAQEILMEYEDRISQLTLVPGENGMFEVALGDSLVFSKQRLGRHPEAGRAGAPGGRGAEGRGRRPLAGRQRACERRPASAQELGAVLQNVANA